MLTGNCAYSAAHTVKKPVSPPVHHLKARQHKNHLKKETTWSAEKTVRKAEKYAEHVSSKNREDFIQEFLYKKAKGK